jgi:hypothetical protein
MRTPFLNATKCRPPPMQFGARRQFMQMNLPISVISM